MESNTQNLERSLDAIARAIVDKKNKGGVCGFLTSSTESSHSATIALLTLTMTDAPAGDYLITVKFSARPSGGGNSTNTITQSGSTGTLSINALGLHGNDADFNAAKYAHRFGSGVLLNHQGGTFTVTLTFSPESAVATIFGLAGDGRWSRYLSAHRID